jgi:oligopeptidase A
MPAWDDAVKTFALRSEADELLGTFYVDLYPRENKRGGAWMNALVTRLPDDPRYSHHVGLFCANFTPPGADRPALLTHREVETLFHEFGHLMHHLLTTVEVRSLAGTAVAWDFVELPSQIMENWCWEREALDLFACHFETGESIPNELYEKLNRTRTFRAGSHYLRQMTFATLDLALHREFDPNAGESPIEYALEIFRKLSPTWLPNDYAMVASFGHLFSSPVGYAAAYYSYAWAEVLDADAYSRFRDEGIFNPATGRDFRKLLASGNSQDPLDLFENFMGREPQIDALLTRSGLNEVQ